MKMVTIDKRLCKGCNICAEFCPRGVYKKSGNMEKGVNIPIPEHQEECRKCNICALLCPDQAICVDEQDEG